MEEPPCDPLEPTNVFCRRPQQDSDDSENEGGLGNVTRVVMRPPGHSGKAKRGHLCFDASFETGNLGRVDLISEFEYDLFIRPDTCNPRLRLWFNFTVDNIRADQRVIFNIVNLSKSKNLFRDGMTPIVKSTSRPKWQRMPSKHVYYYRSPEHHNHYVLSFAFGFDREEDVYQFALSFPYSYSRYQAHAEILEKRHFTFLKREELAKSVQQRRVELLTLSHPQNLRPGRRQRVVCVLCRIHPGEAPTSYVCQGLIDFLVSSHPIALALREYVVFKIVPMLNPDGVFLGNYRSTVMGFDLNRTWHQSSPWAHPSLHAVHEMLAELDQNKNVDLDFVLDLHAHSSLLGAFIYGNTYEDVYRYERHIVFPKLLAQNAEDYNPANTMYNRDPNKAGTARRYFCAALKESVNCYTLEVSLFGYQRPNGPGIIPYTEEAYFRLGRNVARTFYDYYKAIGVMPSSLATSLLHGSSSNLTSSARKANAVSGSGTSNKSAPSAMLHLRGVATTSSMASTGSTEEDEEDDDDDLDEESTSPVTRTARPLRLSLPSPTPWSILQFPSNHSQSDVTSAPCSFALPSRPLGSPKHNIGQRTLPGRKVGGGGVIGRTTRSVSGNQVASSRVQLNQPPPPPSLTIIDFNQLTRGGLELATGRGHGASRSRRVGTSRHATSSSPRRVRRHRSCSGLHPRRPAV